MILQGNIVAQKIYHKIEKDLKYIKKTSLYLATILVGENPASITYVKIKEKKAEKLGINFRFYHLPANALQKEVEKLINHLNKDRFTAGIILQLPLPKDFKTDEVLKKISPKKDIDGFQKTYPSPTAQAILEILKFYNIGINDKKIVIVGRGRLVGEPLEYLLKKQGILPTVCDSKTKDLKAQTLKADILISGAGQPGFITLDMVREKAIVIDAGTSESCGKIVGDVEPETYQKVKSYTPVPGGVGPVTVACLFRNFVKAAKIFRGNFR